MMKTGCLAEIENTGGARLISKCSITAPRLYRVIMHRDDFTPIEFMAAVLEELFNLDQVTAMRLMDKIYLNGKAVCGVFSWDVADTKVRQVAQCAKKHEHPLLCSLEEGVF